METLHIIAETRDYLVVDKPSGLPTVPLKSDKSGKDTLLSRIAQQYPEVLKIGANQWEGGVLHRLDNQTNGLVLVARNQDTFNDLMDQQEHRGIEKVYLAVSSRHLQQVQIGFPPFPFGDITKKRVVITSLFRPFGEKGREVRPVSEESPSSWRGKSTGVWYETEVTFRDEHEGAKRFWCTIAIGFRHQIRCHMEWAGYPLDGDTAYHGMSGKPFGLTAMGISFVNPANGKKVRYQLEEGDNE